jgi:dihydrodipicolinate synthase/N-acetylneuraminate lyase
VKAAMALMGLLDDDAVRAPLLTLDAEGRATLALTLRTLGLLERPGGRAGAPVQPEAVA